MQYRHRSAAHIISDISTRGHDPALDRLTRGFFSLMDRGVLSCPLTCLVSASKSHKRSARSRRVIGGKPMMAPLHRAVQSRAGLAIIECRNPATSRLRLLSMPSGIGPTIAWCSVSPVILENRGFRARGLPSIGMTTEFKRCHFPFSSPSRLTTYERNPQASVLSPTLTGC